MVDKNLFLYDLAVVAIMKNEGSYLKEWLDYHLLAGVKHFYIYDNDSTDNQAEVAKPYVAAGLVDYIPFPGKVMQYISYNDAVKNFKFQARYMAFIDCDEFVYPKVDGGDITTVADEILSHDPNATGLAINWQIFGSNGQDKADYSKGVLERFTRRAPKDWSAQCPQEYTAGNIHVKTLANPRAINFVSHPHFPFYFEAFRSVNETGKIVQGHNNNPVMANKIVVNHYYTKSLEEFRIKQSRGRSGIGGNYNDAWYDFYNRNEVFDDGILRYREARAKNFSLENEAERLNRVIEALTETLSAYASGKTFSLGTALTCRALSTYLREKFPNETSRWKVYEEASLAAIIKSLSGMSLAEAQLLVHELPKLLNLPYPAVKDLRNACLQIIPQLMNVTRLNIAFLNRLDIMWKDYMELDYIQDMLKLKEV